MARIVWSFAIAAKQLNFNVTVFVVKADLVSNFEIEFEKALDVENHDVPVHKQVLAAEREECW